MDALEDSVVQRIFSFTDIATLLLRCRPLSRRMLSVADQEVQHRITAVFAWVATDVSAMRDCFRLNRAFVGGSLSLTLFSPLLVVPSNADIFVPQSKNTALVHHLIHLEGYTLVTVSAVSPVAMIPNNALNDGTIDVYGAGLITHTVLSRGAIIVQVFTFDDPYPMSLTPDTITLSWTTALFNFVAADFAGCAYPTLTTKGRGLYHAGRFLSAMPGTGSDHKLNAYCELGFEFSQHPNWWFEPIYLRCQRGTNCPFVLRRFGDGGTLLLPADSGPPNPFGRQWMFGGTSEDIHLS
ncbi:hypothetical protein VTO73DRAFT_6171 [Trametes versicolor]